MSKPLAIDLFCGLGGWTEGLLEEGYDVVGFDIERHEYGEHRYPAQLVIQDVRTLHGSQFRDAALIVASPPCQEYSYMAMPWSRAKAIAREYRSGKRDVRKLTELFDTCFRIQREACEAASRHIPMVVENVRGAIPWVGRSRWNYGSFHLWGDVPALMPMTTRRAMKYGVAHGEGRTNFHGTKGVPHFPTGHWTNPAENGVKVPGLDWNDRERRGQTFNTTAEARLRDEIKNGTGGSWFAVANNTVSGHRQNPDGRKQPGISGPRSNGRGDAWFEDGAARHGSKSPARKAASAMIAKIPLPLSRHIARCYA